MALVVSVLLCAVGAGSSSEASPTSLIEFWDGTSWTQQNPNGAAYLYAVGATSASDAWAVGVTVGHQPALAAHWDGSSWQQVAMSTPADRYGFTGIAATSTTDAWAVGWHGKVHETVPLIEHWNGSAWTIAESPEPGKNSVLNGVAALSPRNVWAVGSFTPYGYRARLLVLHWNGRAWKRIRPPLGLSRSSSGSWLNAVAVVSARNVWAVGNYSPRSSSRSNSTLVLHWNGKKLRRVRSTDPGGDRGFSNWFADVAAVGRSNVWAVGATNSNRRSQKPQRPLIEHWNGHSWRTVASPTRFGQCYPSGLNALAPLARNDIWAAGSATCEVSGVGASTQPLAEHWNGRAWSVSPIVNSPGSLGGYYYFLDIAAASHHAVWAVGY